MHRPNPRRLRNIVESYIRDGKSEGEVARAAARLVDRLERLRSERGPLKRQENSARAPNQTARNT